MGKMFKGCLTGVGALVLVIIIIVIIVVATGGGGDESSGGESSESSSGSNGGSEEQTYSVGDEVEVGDVTYVINGMETASSAGIEGLEEEASGIYIVLDVEVTNNGNEAITMGSSYIKLLNDDNTYEADDFNSELFVEEINPDSTATGDVVFDVNEDVAEAEGLQAQVQEGILGNNSAKVNLNE